LDKKSLQARISANDLMKQLAPAAAPTAGVPVQAAAADDIAQIPEIPEQSNI